MNLQLTFSSTSPNIQIFILATLVADFDAFRMRVDNKIELYDYLGSPLGKLEFDELLLAGANKKPKKQQPQDEPQKKTNLPPYFFQKTCTGLS